MLFIEVFQHTSLWIRTCFSQCNDWVTSHLKSLLFFVDILGRKRWFPRRGCDVVRPGVYHSFSMNWNLIPQLFDRRLRSHIGATGSQNLQFSLIVADLGWLVTLDDRHTIGEAFLIIHTWNHNFHFTWALNFLHHRWVIPMSRGSLYLSSYILCHRERLSRPRFWTSRFRVLHCFTSWWLTSFFLGAERVWNIII